MARRRFFNKNQPRDKNGRWKSTGGSASKKARAQSNNRRKLAVSSIGTTAGMGYVLAGPIGAVAGATVATAGVVKAARKYRKTRKK